MNGATIPDLPEFDTYYGVRVSDIGEDGDLIILGHHDKRRVLAALNRHARKVWGFTDLYDGTRPSEPMVDEIAVEWATLKESCDHAGDADHAEDCGECIEITNNSWYIECGPRPVPNSFPVMYWRA